MQPKKDPPRDWPRMSSAVYYDAPREAIDWLVKAFGFEVRLLVEGEGGKVEHSELVYGGGLVFVSDAAGRHDRRASPKSLEGRNTQAIMVFVDDADAHCEIARAAGATIVAEPKTSDYGDDYWVDRGYEALDLEGHHWWFYHRVRDGKAK